MQYDQRMMHKIQPIHLILYDVAQGYRRLCHRYALRGGLSPAAIRPLSRLAMCKHIRGRRSSSLFQQLYGIVTMGGTHIGEFIKVY